LKKAIFRFSFDCGRGGDLEGTFISTQEKVDKLIESEIEVYFGEVLGKHSEVYGTIEELEIDFISDNPEVVKVVEDHGLSNGHNPFEYQTLNFEFDGETLDITVDEAVDMLIKSELKV